MDSSHTIVASGLSYARNEHPHTQPPQCQSSTRDPTHRLCFGIRSSDNGRFVSSDERGFWIGSRPEQHAASNTAREDHPTSSRVGKCLVRPRQRRKQEVDSQRQTRNLKTKLSHVPDIVFCCLARLLGYIHMHTYIQTHKRARSTKTHEANAGACSHAIPKHGYLRPPNASIMLRQLLIRQWAIRILRRTWLLDRFLPRTTRSLKHSPRKSSRELCELENAVVAKDGQSMTNKEPQDCAIIKVRQDSIITTHTNVHTVHVNIE